MIFNDAVNRIRALCRDLHGDVWSDADIMAYWNEAQNEIAAKAGMIERVEANFFPPQYTYSYFWDFEHEFTEGDRHQALNIHQQTGMVLCYPWEAAYWLSVMTTPDDGSRFIHPWETVYCTSSESVPLLLNAHFHRMKFAAYDQEQITPLPYHELVASDRYNKSRKGKVTHYCREDEFSNKIYLYPQPTTAVWQEKTEADYFDDLGGLSVSGETILDAEDVGMLLETITTENALFTVYEALPVKMSGWDEVMSWPDYLVKYVEYATLERMFGADTDGFIPSLRDYWRQRKEIGIEAIKKFRRMRVSSRTYILGGSESYTHGRGGALPEGYPPI
jgi:hypothetical protein